MSRYKCLERYARAFAEGHLNLFILCGGAGAGKSQCVRGAVEDGAAWIDGTASAFGIYLQAYEHRNKPVILDDVDGLCRDRNGIRVLKSLCQTDLKKTLSWHSSAPARFEVPKEFSTTTGPAAPPGRRPTDVGRTRRGVVTVPRLGGGCGAAKGVH